MLKKEEFSETKLGQLESDFCVDDHSYWPKDEDKKKQSQIENQWKDISERMETEMETFSKEASESSGGLIDQVKVENRERMDYREFLRKFSVLKEEMTVDPDSFDYNFYKLWIVVVWEYAIDRAAGVEGSPEGRRICDCDRYINVVLRRTGEKVSGRDIWCVE